MKLLFLGSGAADWKMGTLSEFGEYRRNSSALIDGCILIDPGRDVPEALVSFHVPAEEIRYILITHSHRDHCNEETVALLKKKGAEVICLRDGEKRSLGQYTVCALKGNHGTADDTVHYLISDQVSTLFYALDGAWLLYPEYMAIKALGKGCIDYAVLDATIGDCEGDYRIFEHNNLRMVSEIQKTLAPYVKRFCISHMARTLHTDHATLAERMKKEGFETAYDGMTVEF